MSYDKPIQKKLLKRVLGMLLFAIVLSQVMASQAVKLLNTQNGPCERKFYRADDPER